ncbi:MAG: baseplate J/gp47 family protein [Peptococcaceae bacterium]|jgi:phage-related baseplate assembly protein|nr:baseplate J/gp47 family protein [Peptococcaceae bacterium]MDH7525296.1 baseplate J/gp47 family protein [Peptococcaceae bacterium]
MSDITFINGNAEEILNSLINDFEKALGEPFYPGDERRIFLQQLAQVIVSLYNSLNDTGRQNLLRYARGKVLDALGERTDIPRLPAQKSTVTLRFNLSSAQGSHITIPAGTRATPDNNLYFATKQVLVIPAGATTGDVIAEATVAGAAHNGFVPGQINQLVDQIPFVAGVVNIDTSSGGADIEADDDGVNVWSGYRERIREAPSKFSTAGPRDGYIARAKSADANIQDVAVTFPETIKEFNLAAFQAAYPAVDPTPFYTEIPAGKVKISVLMKDGELPSQAILDKVLAVCNGEKTRPMTDNVTVEAPAQVSYDIAFTYYISKDDSTLETQIKNAIEGTGGAVEQYKAWQNGKMGRAINPDYLRNLVLTAKACRIDITSPVYTTVDKDKVATTGTVTVIYGGLL